MKRKSSPGAEAVNRRDAMSKIFLGAAGLSLASCSAETGSTEASRGTMGTSRQALADAGYVVPDPPVGDPANPDAASAASNWTILDNFFREVESSGKIGIIPGGTYFIDQPLTLPRTGRVMGSGINETFIRAFYDSDIFRIISDFGIGGLELSHIRLLGRIEGNPGAGAGIRLCYPDVGLFDCYFHDIIIEGTDVGINAEAMWPPEVSLDQGTGTLRGTVFERITIRAYRYAMRMRSSVDCVLRQVGSDHSNLEQNHSEEADFLFEGVLADGGLNLDKVGSLAPYQNGVVIRNFAQVWGRHVNGDEAWIRGVWVQNCKEIYLTQCFTSLCGRHASATNTVGYCMVVEGDTTDPTSAASNTRIVLDDCFFGQGVTNGLLLKRVTSATVSNSMFIASDATALEISECENISIVGCVFQQPGPIQSIVQSAINVDSSLFVSVTGCQFSRFSCFGGSNIIKASFCHNVTISNNCLKGTSTNSSSIQAISSYLSDFGIIADNQISGYFHGVDIYGGSNNVIKGNNLRGLGAGGGDIGLSIRGTFACSVTGNCVALFSYGVREQNGPVFPHHNGYVGNVLTSNATGKSLLMGTGTIDANNIV